LIPTPHVVDHCYVPLHRGPRVARGCGPDTSSTCQTEQVFFAVMTTNRTAPTLFRISVFFRSLSTPPDFLRLLDLLSSPPSYLLPPPVCLKNLLFLLGNFSGSPLSSHTKTSCVPNPLIFFHLFLDFFIPFPWPGHSPPVRWRLCTLSFFSSFVLFLKKLLFRFLPSVRFLTELSFFFSFFFVPHPGRYCSGISYVFPFLTVLPSACLER